LDPKEFLYAIDHGPMDYGDEFNFGIKAK
jgi:hypothetical protein